MIHKFFFRTMRPWLRQVRMALNRFKYKATSVHSTSYLASGSDISMDLSMGPYGYIGPRARICSAVKMGAYVMIGPDVAIVANEHNYDRVGTPIIFSGRPDAKETIIGSDVWIATRATILAGVRIGDGAIIAAGALVVRDVNEYDIVGGVPARAIRRRFTESEIELHREWLRRPPAAGEYCGPINFA